VFSALIRFLPRVNNEASGKILKVYGATRHLIESYRINNELIGAYVSILSVVEAGDGTEAKRKENFQIRDEILSQLTNWVKELIRLDLECRKDTEELMELMRTLGAPTPELPPRPPSSSTD
jgi:hypothetical protein